MCAATVRWRALMLGWLLGDRSDDRDGSAAVSAGPQLCLIALSHDFLALHNGGAVVATDVRVDLDRSSIAVVNRADEPFDLRPGESWTFLIDELGPWQESGWQVTVTWAGQQEPVCIPLPAGAM